MIAAGTVASSGSSWRSVDGAAKAVDAWLSLLGVVPSRRTPSMRRISTSACSETDSMVSNAVRAAPGSRSRTFLPPRAWRIETVIECVTASWRSRAILIRSAATASCSRRSASADARSTSVARRRFSAEAFFARTRSR